MRRRLWQLLNVLGPGGFGHMMVAPLAVLLASGAAATTTIDVGHIDPVSLPVAGETVAGETVAGETGAGETGASLAEGDSKTSTMRTALMLIGSVVFSLMLIARRPD